TRREPLRYQAGAFALPGGSLCVTRREPLRYQAGAFALPGGSLCVTRREPGNEGEDITQH
ncbi:hypothetical protein, partial [Microseira wollei]|uniref:hypothetical protein n=1 Tax=Microseira wollei TaxID=467598 RepID=UPI001CFDE893